MKIIGTPVKKSGNIDSTLKKISARRSAPVWAHIVIVVLYIITSLIVNRLSDSKLSVIIGSSTVPIRICAGIFTSVTNICILFMVVYYGKLGFWSAIALLTAQFPLIIHGIFIRHNVQSLAGLFTNILTIIAVMILYSNEKKINRYQRKIRKQAVTDRLTGLPNRFACSELVNALINQNEKFAVVSLDLNNFKSINDTMGHDFGNKVLHEAAKRWKNAADSDNSGTRDFIARIGGDEFAIIIRNYNSAIDIVKTINFYKSVLENRMIIDDCEFFLTSSFGYAEYPSDAVKCDTLLRSADAAMYEVKRLRSGNNIIHFTPSLLKSERTLEIERKIRDGLDNDKLFFNLQPQFTMEHKLRGFEALARLEDADGSVMQPKDFISVAEKAGLIDKVDLTIFRKAVYFFGNVVKNTGSKALLSVNISVKHLMKVDFIDELCSILESSGLPSGQLELEITESVMIDSEKAIERINRLKKMGIKIAIDDFGTGFSSLSYLNRFPADLLKVDKSFIDQMNIDESSKQYVAAIISMGHILKLKVISEGVEKEDQLETLKNIGCDYIQGFLWGTPLLPEEAEALVKEQLAL